MGRTVPDSLRNRNPIVRGRKPTNPLSVALLEGKTRFEPGARGKTWGSIYKLAKNHNRKAHIQWIQLNDEAGYLMWFEDIIKED